MQTSKSLLLAATSLIALGMITMSFQDSSKHQLQVKHMIADTVPDKHITIDLNVNDIMREVDKELQNVDKAMKEIQWENISRQVEESIKNINLDKIQKEITASLDKIDLEKIKVEINRSVKEINTEKFKDEMKKAMEEVKSELNSEEFKRSMEEIKNINTEKLRAELSKVRRDLEKNKINIHLEMKKAKEELARANGELGEYKAMMSEMRKDGLINSEDAYDIQYKNKELYINGKKQSPAVTNKYRKYFRGNDFELKRNNESSKRNEDAE
ncbi:MAG: hypothetical protein ABJA57_02690 [Ginsengibacter sp.]